MLRGRLVEVDLRRTPKPSYDAISYSWRRDILHGQVHLIRSVFWPDKYKQFQVESAAEALCRPILCDGKLLRVQPNLYDFLIRLKRLNRLRPLWIDAICIDQDERDPAARDEKMKQLHIMGEIYEKADAVLVWLGESKHVSSSFPKYLEKLRDDMGPHQYEPYSSEHDVLKQLDRPSRNAALYSAGGLKSEQSWVQAIAEVYKRLRPSNSLLRVLGRNYFQRAWVVQEIALAKELTFFVGSMQIPAASLLKGIQLLDSLSAGGMGVGSVSMSYKPDHASGHSAVPHLLKSREDRFAGRNWRFEDFLFLCRDREATRAEDKIFSILGLAEEELRDSLRYDTSQDVDPQTLLHTLYVNCAVMVAQRRCWPYVLQLVGKSADAITETTITAVAGGAGDGAGQEEEGVQLPSWAPDLRVPLLPKPLWFYGCTHYRAATSVTPAFFNVVREPGVGWTLSLSAAQVGVVEQVGESHGELDLYNLGSVEGHMLDLVSKLGYEYEPGRRMGRRELSMDAFLRCMTGDVFKRRPTMLDRIGEPTTKLRKHFREWIENNYTENEDMYSGYSGKILAAASGPARRAFGTVVDRSTADINGFHLAISDARNAFLEVHDSDTYPMAEDFDAFPSRYRDRVSEEAQGQGATDKSTTASRRPLFLYFKPRRRNSLESGKVMRKQKWLREFENERAGRGKVIPGLPIEGSSQREEMSKSRPRRASSVPAYLPSMHMHENLTNRMKRFRHDANPTGAIFLDEASDADTFTSDDDKFNVANMIRMVSKSRDVATAINSIYKDRRIFRTTGNFVGISHDTVAKGDVVVLVAGAPTPFVFRTLNDESGCGGEPRFRLIGSAYVHGIMYGELTEGTPIAEFHNMVVM